MVTKNPELSNGEDFYFILLTKITSFQKLVLSLFDSGNRLN